MKSKTYRMRTLWTAICLLWAGIAAARPATITYDRPGAIYHRSEKGSATVTILDTLCRRVELLVRDVDERIVVQAREYDVSEPGKRVIRIPLRTKQPGYYTLEVKADGWSQPCRLGFGVIPDVTLREKDWDSPFGVCGHYQRYKKWMIGDVQQRLGIAWVRDEADWHTVVSSGVPRDPYLDYLDSKNICWLALFNYVDSYHGIQGEDGIWRWNDDVEMIRRYVEMHKGHIRVYESQNEPNNFGGWSKRWPHPQNQQWRPQGWGKPFADLIKQMYSEIKSVDPQLRLMWPGEDEWIEYFVRERDAAPSIDLTSIHPYVNKEKYPETERFATGFYTRHKALLRTMEVPTEMWATEIGWSAYRTTGEVERYVPVSEVEQAAFLVRSYLLHLYHGASKVFWYEMNDEPFGEENPESYFGIIRYNDMLTVKPSAVAYANLVADYRHAKPVGRFISQDDQLYGFAYENGPVQQFCLWRMKDSRSITLELPATRKIRLTDIFGRSRELRVIDGRVTFELGICPLTVRGISRADFRKLYSKSENL